MEMRGGIVGSKELGLVVDQLLGRFSRKFEIRALDDRIHRAGFLAETTIDALRHVDVVARCSAAAVCPRFSLDRNRLGRTNRLTQFARNATFFPLGIAAQHMFTPKTWADRVLLLGIVDRRFWLDEIFQLLQMSRDDPYDEQGLD